MSRKSALRALAESVDKKYGSGTVAFGVTSMRIPRLETGSLSLDIALGGGIPVGRTTMFYGEKSSAKTTTAYRTAALAQSLCANCLRHVDTEVVEGADEETGEVEWVQKGTCDCAQSGLFVPKQYPDEKKADFADRVDRYSENSYEPFRVAIFDFEASFDRNWASKLGLDERLILYVRPDTAEEGIDIYDSLLRTGAVDLMILDSLAAMTPSKEVEESTEKWQQGLQARLLNKFCRKTQSSINAVSREYGRTPTQIWINQIRMKIGVVFGNPETVPGGLGQGFVTSCEVKLWTSSYDVQDIESVPGKEKDLKIAKSVMVNFAVEKNKTAPPKGRGSYTMMLADGSVDQVNLYVSLCERYGELSRDGSKWVLGINKYGSKRNAIEALQGKGEWARITSLLRARMIQ
jgi:protein RecA